MGVESGKRRMEECVESAKKDSRRKSVYAGPRFSGSPSVFNCTVVLV